MKKIWMTICTLALGLALLTGCGQKTTTTAEPIGIDAAKTLALEDAEVSADAASFTTAGLDQKMDTEYYDVEFTVNGETYEYDIDAITGVIIEKKVPGGQPPAASSAGTGVDTTTAQTGTTGGEATSGGAADTTTSTATGSAATNGSMIGEATAQAKALAHAGLTTNNVTFVRSHLDWDDGRQVYDVEFYTNDYKEYDYEIDAYTGDVLSYDYDAEYYGGGNTSSSSGTAITEAEAKAIALGKVPGATESDIWEFSIDRDDGRLEYEGEILYNGTKYEFEIDGYSGAIRSWEVESRRW